jgi:hypothetical protein
LATVTNTFVNTPSLVLSIAGVDAPKTCNSQGPSPCTGIDGLYAGQDITAVEVQLSGGHVFGVTNARFSVVWSDVTRAQAQEGACNPGNWSSGAAGREAVVEPWGDEGAKAAVDSGNSAILKAQYNLNFRMGGVFRICYSHDGTFRKGHADLVPMTLTVNGIYEKGSSTCNTTDCLMHRPYGCYVMRNNYNIFGGQYSTSSSCRIEYSHSGSGYELPDMKYGKGSWSPAFGATYDAKGLVASVIPKACGSDIAADFVCQSGSSCDDASGTRYIMPDATADYKEIALPVTRNTLDAASYKAYTVAACFCPDLGICDDKSLFIQQIGLLHFYAARVCAPGNGTACSPDYTGVAAAHRFAIRLDCPTDACPPGAGSRIKILGQTTENEAPSWSTTGGCRSAEHGLNIRGVPVLLYNDSNPDVYFLDGGDRQDYKIFASGTGFRLRLGDNHQEDRNFEFAQMFDICFCRSNCTKEYNWFKAGAIRSSPFRLSSAHNKDSIATDEWAVEYVGLPGSIAFHRPVEDYTTFGLQEGGLIKIADNMTKTDADCVAAGYDQGLTPGLTEKSAFELHVGTRPFRTLAGAGVDSPDRLVFNSNNPANTITVKRAGIVAVCYCAVVNTGGQCANSRYWMLAVSFTVKGPKPHQEWLVSTHVPFRFEYYGFGLTKHDKVRIIGGTAECTDNNFDPDTAAFEFTGLKVQCPDPCVEVGYVSDVIDGALSVTTLADDKHACDPQNENCFASDIRAITVLDNTTTELEFTNAPALLKGDVVTLGDNILCFVDKNGVADPRCTDDTIAALRGFQQYGDANDNTANAPDMHLMGHVINSTKDPTKFTISIGWNNPVPKFTIQKTAAGKEGRWTVVSRAITKEEIMGVSAKENLKVCWRTPPYGGVSGRFVSEIGTLTLVDPHPLADCLVSLSAMGRNQRAPMILSFKTASGAAGQRYSKIQGSTQIKIIFQEIDKLDAVLSDTNTLDIESSANEDEVVEATQYICGKLFKELWSSDPDNGFPMPKGCYHRSYGFRKGEDVGKRELYLVFETWSGLKAGHEYQIVLNGVAKPLAQTGGVYVHTFLMDDIHLKPYEAVERGLCGLQKAPIPQADEAEQVLTVSKFLDPGGFRIMGGDSELLELTGTHLTKSQPLQVEMSGDSGMASIRRDCVIRVFLWPLTQWNTEPSCEADCQAPQEYEPCGQVQACEADSVVPGHFKNVLRIVLPRTMPDLRGSLRYYLNIYGIKLPDRGFFAGRFAAQIAQKDESFPHFVLSDGDWPWRKPTEGSTIAQILSAVGDGNNAPFRGDVGNILYMRVILGATLFSRVETGDAYFTVTMPPGYSCFAPDEVALGVPEDGSTWEAPYNLTTFGGKTPFGPQGRGFPDDRFSPTRGWTTVNGSCTFTLRRYAALFAGSSLYWRMQINQPQEALKRSDPNNKWTFALTSKGYFQKHVTVGNTPFLDTPGNDNTENVAVLGKLSHVRLQPSSFIATGNPYKPNVDEYNFLHIFFKTEQAAGARGFVYLDAPDGYDFSNRPKDPVTGKRSILYAHLDYPCVAMDLPDLYYATGQTISPTHRLPMINSCQYRVHPYNRATVGFSRILEADTAYGFKVRVKNPSPPEWFLSDPNWFKAIYKKGFRLYTATRDHHVVDGAYGRVPFMLRNDTHWPIGDWGPGLYWNYWVPDGTWPCTLHVQDLRPFSVTRMRTWVLIKPIRILPPDSDYNARLTAPLGYIWDFEDHEFLHIANSTVTKYAAKRNANPNRTAELRAMVLPNISHDWPGGIPERNTSNNATANLTGNVLWWPKLARYNTLRADEYQEFGFQAMVRIPDRPPPASMNVFFFEFGYTSHILLNRRTALVIEAPKVKSLLNADVEYETNVELDQNMITLQIETASNIPEGGGFLIKSPDEFIFSRSCRPMPADPPALPVGFPYPKASDLPDDVTCTSKSEKDAEGKIKGSVIRIRAGPMNITPALYRFKLDVKNPQIPGTDAPRRDGPTPCRAPTCWHFSAVQDILRNESLDLPLYTRGFAINFLMPMARMVKLTEEQRLAVGQNDRPLQSSQLVFVFSLSDTSEQNGELKIRGPEGFEFKEECLDDVEIRLDQVFGGPHLVPQDEDSMKYDAFEEGVNVTNCFGSGPRATINISVGRISYGLLGRKNYAFRIGVLRNPPVTPKQNVWTLEYTKSDSTDYTIGETGESSRPFPGFRLWTFIEDEVIPVSTAQSVVANDQPRKAYPVTIRFRPFNDIRRLAGRNLQPQEVPEIGQMRVIAPEGYEFSHINNECFAKIKELGGWEGEELLWGDTDLRCFVDYKFGRILTVTLRSQVKRIKAGSPYELVVMVYNPDVVTQKRGFWTVQSFTNNTNDEDSLRDEKAIVGYPVSKLMSNFEYLNEDEYTGELIQNGMTMIRNLYFGVRFPDQLQKNDKIVLEAPEGFDLTGTPSNSVSNVQNCAGFQWEPKDVTYLQRSKISCQGNFMTFEISELNPFPAEADIKMSVDVPNPAKTPELTRNFWRASHYSQRGQMLSSAVIQSWSIIPQLSDVDIRITGSREAAGAVSSIEVVFTTVSYANGLILEAVSPRGFDFRGQDIKVSSSGHEILSSSGSEARFRVVLGAGERTVLRIEGVRFGQPGGPTLFNLRTTKDGDVQDERLNFNKGFRLPGQFVVTKKQLIEIHSTQPEKYPVQSLWGVRMGKAALAYFDVFVTRGAPSGCILRVQAPPYVLFGEGFFLQRGRRHIDTDFTLLDTEVLEVGPSGLIARMGGSLPAGVVHTVVVPVTTPNIREAKAVDWDFEVLDGDALPLNTNDAETPAFPLVSDMGFHVSVVRSAPMMEVVVTMTIDPEAARPNAIRIVAPPRFNFTGSTIDTCLVEPTAEVHSCEPGGFVAGRESVILRCPEAGLSEESFQVQIVVTCPDKTPSSKGWFLEGLRDEEQAGWGEAAGFNIVQMPASFVLYAGVPGISGHMIFHFQTLEKMRARGIIQIEYPPTYQVQCDGDFFKKLTLPGWVTCDDNTYAYRSRITMNNTLNPGTYAFVVTGTALETASDYELFHLQLLESDLTVHDGAMNLPGQKIIRDVSVAALPFVWSNSEPNQLSVVTIGFDLLSTVQVPLLGLLFTLPIGFEHRIERSSDFVIHSPFFVINGSDKRNIHWDDSWLDWQSGREVLRVFIEPSTTLEKGKYEFDFPTLVPMKIPPFNAWTLSLCSVPVCTSREDPNVIVTLPVAGFNHGEIHPNWNKKAAAGAYEIGGGVLRIIGILFLRQLASKV